MNTTFAGRFVRPEGVPETEPLPIALNNSFTFDLEVRKVPGGRFKFLSTSTLYMTIKLNLTDADGSAKFQSKTGDPDDPFLVVNNSRGLARVDVPAATMLAALVKDTIYYVDVEVITPEGAVYTVLQDTIRPWKQTTDAVT
jgi:hypothetical protein